MFRSEYIAEADPELCSGCQACTRVCQFEAITYDAADSKVTIDPTSCYGCGICRSVCSKDAIKLSPRTQDPVAAKLW